MHYNWDRKPNELNLVAESIRRMNDFGIVAYNGIHTNVGQYCTDNM